jgi:hypothetical protein
VVLPLEDSGATEPVLMVALALNKKVELFVAPREFPRHRRSLANMKTCRRCQRGNPADARFCHFDGEPLPAESPPAIETVAAHPIAAPPTMTTVPKPDAAPPTMETVTEPSAAPAMAGPLGDWKNGRARHLAVAAMVFLAMGLAFSILQRDHSERRVTAAPTPAANSSASNAPSPTVPDRDVTDDAINRGIAYLKNRLATYEVAPRHSDVVAEPWSGIEQGKRAMMAYTLLECGEPIGELNIHRTARHVRDYSKRPLPTWSLAWTIRFLDRLGEPMDNAAIRSLSLRLAAGQFKKGNWNNVCPPLSAGEEQTFVAYLTLASRVETLSPQEKAKLCELEIQWEKCRQSNHLLPRTVTGAIAENGDNSNTYFATLGLRAARRQDLPLGAVLTRLNQHLRATQHVDGSWWWVENFPHNRATMTCAGILGLAVSQPDGFLAPGGAQADDPMVAKGLRFLDHAVVSAQASPGKRTISNRIVGVEADDNLEFLWSLAQVAELYRIDRFAEQDWYAWASPRIVAAQRFDGSWADSNPGPVDTCYALLVLRSANARNGPSRQPGQDSHIPQRDRHANSTSRR